MICSLQSLNFGYDDVTILKDVTVNINYGERIALIGANGAGKTTLLKLITKEYIPTVGEVFHKNGLTIGYLAQNSGLDSTLTVVDELKTVYTSVMVAFSRLEELYHELATANPTSRQYKELSNEQHNLEALISAKDGYNIDVKIKTIINGFGFAGDENKNVSVMSGGEKTRLAFMKLLLTEPELLILDEPTNHLDYDTLLFLERYLTNYKGTILTVSHDRYFIDTLCDHIWDLEGLTITEYSANYSKYKELKAEKIEYQLKEYEKQSIKVASMLDYAQRNIARATTSKSARSRLKQLDNMEMLEKPITYTKPPKFHFETTIQSAKEVLTVKEYPLIIGERVLSDKVSFKLYRGERLAILGKNGTGKSTLIRRLIDKSRDTLSELDPTANIKFGVNVSVSYYDQENKNINTEDSVLEALWNEYHLMGQTQIRSILAQMLLDEGDINKKTGMLSGGERAKLAYALIIAAKANLLIMDEPTNHIDLITRESLEDALLEYDGTLIFVSHDRYFIKKLATKIADFDNGIFSVYEEDYGNYLELKEKVKKDADKVAKTDTSDKSKNNAYKAKKSISKIKQDLKKIEEKIAIIENESAMLTEKVAEFVDFATYTENSETLLKLTKELDDLYRIWETLSHEVENL